MNQSKNKVVFQDRVEGAGSLNVSCNNSLNESHITKITVPELDFTKLKQVKEFKDWYSYAKKLEEVIPILRKKVKAAKAELKLVRADREKVVKYSEKVHSINVS